MASSKRSIWRPGAANNEARAERAQTLARLFDSFAETASGGERFGRIMERLFGPDGPRWFSEFGPKIPVDDRGGTAGDPDVQRIGTLATRLLDRARENPGRDGWLLATAHALRALHQTLNDEDWTRGSDAPAAIKSLHAWAAGVLRLEPGTWSLDHVPITDARGQIREGSLAPAFDLVCDCVAAFVETERRLTAVDRIKRSYVLNTIGCDVARTFATSVVGVDGLSLPARGSTTEHVARVAERIQTTLVHLSANYGAQRKPVEEAATLITQQLFADALTAAGRDDEAIAVALKFLDQRSKRRET